VISFGTIDKDDVSALALTFALVVRDWCRDGEFEQILEGNVGAPLDCCASHDVMDANMAMDAAFRFLFGRGCTLPCDVEEGKATEAQEDHDMGLWNMAWTLAQKRWLVAGGEALPPGLSVES